MATRLLLLLCLAAAADLWTYALPENGTAWTWGPYRPNLYFGVRPTAPETALMGLAWASGQSQDELLKCEFVCVLFLYTVYLAW